MVTYFLDSSALAKRYLDEPGSAWTKAVATDERNVLIIARITLVEIASALSRRRREAAISDVDYADQLGAIRFDARARYQIVELTSTITDEALHLTTQHALRAYDAVQLASGLFANRAVISAGTMPLVFLSADERLNAIAQAEGLNTDNPARH